MKSNVILLDCTMRDGGYINDWKFGSNAMTFIFDRLSRAGIEIIEAGFLDDRREFDTDRSIQPDTESFSKILSKTESSNSMVTVMIDYGTCSLDNIQPCKDTLIDGIRVIFKKHNMENAVTYATALKKLGYQVFLNMVSITSYTDYDILDFVKLVNELNPYTVSIVDTYGLMHKDELLHYYHILDRNLNSEICIGYHAHNNFQLGYSNCIELIRHSSNRKLIIDGTLYGMGKSAGNAPLELLAMHLNEYYEGRYDLDQIMELIDVSIMPIYNEKYWGYTFQYFVSAMNDCHPNYTKYLIDKKTLSMKSINQILSSIEEEQKLMFDTEYIEELYMDYQKRFTAEVDNSCELSHIFENKDILLIGPGSTIRTQSGRINKILVDEALTVSINFIPSEYKPEYVFISNSKRYFNTFNRVKGSDIKIIASSNITPVGEEFNCVLNYEDLIVKEDEITENSLIMFLNYLKNVNPRRVLLAGFDGFTSDDLSNYYDDSMEMSQDYSSRKEFNKKMADKISEFDKDLNITFITDSLYEL